MSFRGTVSVRQLAKRWFTDCSGQFALMLGILAPAVVGLAGGAMDMIVFMNHRAELQATADAAAIAVAKEASLKGWNATTASEVADAVVASSLTNKFGVEHSVYTTIDDKARRASVRIDQDHYAYFVMGLFAGSPQISVSSAAVVSGLTTLCIIVQAPKQKDALVLNGTSSVTASGCSAYSNSKSPDGVHVRDRSVLRTQMTCSAGGYRGSQSNYRPIPITDCPPVSDPLEPRARMIDETVKEGCDHNKVEVKGGKRSLYPGMYCGDITLTAGAQVHFEPGTYIIRKRLEVEKGAVMYGNGVGLIFVGKHASLALANDSTVSLSAPSSGVMAGILIYGQPAGAARKFSIISKNAQKLTGTVYLPDDVLTVGGDGDADGSCDTLTDEDGSILPAEASCTSDTGRASDWTAIIARQLKITAGSTLVMNSDYSGSSVPVPAGIGPSSSRVTLSQ